MKIKQFVSLKENSILIKTDYGRQETFIEIFNEIFDRVKAWMASGVSETEMKELIQNYLENYELRTPKVVENSIKFMEKLGFNFD